MATSAKIVPTDESKRPTTADNRPGTADGKAALGKDGKPDEAVVAKKRHAGKQNVLLTAKHEPYADDGTTYKPRLNAKIRQEYWEAIVAQPESRKPSGFLSWAQAYYTPNIVISDFPSPLVRIFRIVRSKFWDELYLNCLLLFILLYIFIVDGYAETYAPALITSGQSLLQLLCVAMFLGQIFSFIFSCLFICWCNDLVKFMARYDFGEWGFACVMSQMFIEKYMYSGIGRADQAGQCAWIMQKFFPKKDVMKASDEDDNKEEEEDVEKGEGRGKGKTEAASIPGMDTMQEIKDQDAADSSFLLEENSDANADIMVIDRPKTPEANNTSRPGTSDNKIRQGTSGNSEEKNRPGTAPNTDKSRPGTSDNKAQANNKDQNRPDTSENRPGTSNNKKESRPGTADDDEDSLEREDYENGLENDDDDDDADDDATHKSDGSKSKGGGSTGGGSKSLKGKRGKRGKGQPIKKKKKIKIVMVQWKCFVCQKENNKPRFDPRGPQADIYFGQKGDVYKRTYAIIKPRRDIPTCAKCYAPMDYKPPSSTAKMFVNYPNRWEAFAQYPKKPPGNVQAGIADDVVSITEAKTKSFFFGLHNSQDSGLTDNNWKLKKYVAGITPIMPRPVLPPGEFFELSEIVECRLQKSDWARCRIIAVRKNHTYDIKYDPGDELRFVFEDQIRCTPEKHAFAHAVEVSMCFLIITMPLALLSSMTSVTQFVFPLLFVALFLFFYRIYRFIGHFKEFYNAGCIKIFQMSLIYMLPLFLLLLTCTSVAGSSEPGGGYNNAVTLLALTLVSSLLPLYMMRPTWAVVGLILFPQIILGAHFVGNWLAGTPVMATLGYSAAPLITSIFTVKYLRANLHTLWDVSLIMRPNRGASPDSFLMKLKKMITG